MGDEFRGMDSARILLGLCMDGTHLDHIWRPRREPKQDGWAVTDVPRLLYMD